MKAKPRAQNSSEGNSQTTGSSEGVQEQIRHRAYQLYEQRGREDGHDVEDWLQSESDVMAKGVKTGVAA